MSGNEILHLRDFGRQSKLGTNLDGFAQQARVVCRSSRNQRETRLVRFRQTVESSEELDAVHFLRFGPVLLEVGPTGPVRACVNVREERCRKHSENQSRGGPPDSSIIERSSRFYCSASRRCSRFMIRIHNLLRTSTEEPRLDDEAELGTGALPLEQLLGVVPAHAPPGQAASNQNYFALFVSSSCYHDDAVVAARYRFN